MSECRTAFQGTRDVVSVRCQRGKRHRNPTRRNLKHSGRSQPSACKVRELQTDRDSTHAEDNQPIKEENMFSLPGYQIATNKNDLGILLVLCHPKRKEKKKKVNLSHVGHRGVDPGSAWMTQQDGEMISFKASSPFQSGLLLMYSTGRIS